MNLHRKLMQCKTELCRHVQCRGKEVMSPLHLRSAFVTILKRKVWKAVITWNGAARLCQGLLPSFLDAWFVCLCSGKTRPSEIRGKSLPHKQELSLHWSGIGWNVLSIEFLRTPESFTENFSSSCVLTRLSCWWCACSVVCYNINLRFINFIIIIIPCTFWYFMRYFHTNLVTKRLF